MVRAERLVALTQLLRSRGETTVQELADELEVDRRTLLRDLAALREQGSTIVGEPGRGGGVRLEVDRGVMAVHLSLAEVIAMWLAARLARGASALPWGDAASSGMTKLLGSLPPARARTLRALCQRVVVGDPAGAKMLATAGTTPPELLTAFERAFSEGYGLGFDYTDGGGRKTTRRVEPHGLLVTTPMWFVVGVDVGSGGRRMFRMDRIARPRVLADVRFRPDAQLMREMFSDVAHWRPLTGRWA